MTTLSGAELAALDRTLDRALATGDEQALRVLGHGAITSVVAWRGTACRRLPLFTSAAAVERYRRAFDGYLRALIAHHVIPIDSQLHLVKRDDGQLAVYCIQPLLNNQDLAPALLSGKHYRDAERLLTAIVHRIFESVSPRLGLDGQLSNWAMVDGSLRYTDVAIPLMRDQLGRDAIDAELLLSSLPWVVRPAARRLALPRALGHHHDPRAVTIDLAANLLAEGLAPLAPLVLDMANRRLRDRISPEEVQHYHRTDRRLWFGLHALRHLDRTWQRRVRRRAYPFLLPRSLPR